MLSPSGRQFTGRDHREPLRTALKKHGELGPRQTGGRLFPMACVSLEITQRCNLDCTLCYLSDRAELAKDVPLPILLARIDMVCQHYGAGTSLQISGGDPSLRKIEDLEALIRHIRLRGMRSCFMTNGIKATRAMLERLAAAGLDDLALHVDLTQERKGYDTEVSLNEVRDAYIQRAEGLGLRVLFNTTIFEGNFAELPDLVRFFRARADAITLISFQMQADTGRGVLRERDGEITQNSVTNAISEGMGLALDYDAVSVGHAHCNRYTSLLVSGGEVISPLTNRPLIEDAIAALDDLDEREEGNLDVRRTLRRIFIYRPRLALRLLAEAGKWVWQLRRGLIRSKGRASRMSILVHNFMDASKLEKSRCESCVFMVATENGPLSMCVHNAERDSHIFAPMRIETELGPRWWNAETGEMSEKPDAPVNIANEIIPRKRLKGRMKAEQLEMRSTVVKTRNRAGGDSK